MLCAKLEVNVDEADILEKSLNPDSLDWCKCFVRDNKLIVEIVTKKVGTVLYTVDDYILNLKVSLEILHLLNSILKEG